MTILYENLKKLRESLGMTQKDFASSLSLKLTTYNGYETGAREPKSDFLLAVATKYGVTIDYLLGFSDNPHLTSTGEPNFKLNSNEINHIKKYRALDEHGKEMVDIVLIKETARMEKEKISSTQNAEDNKVIKLQEPIQAASAGYGEFADDETSDTVTVKYNSLTSKADYIMRVAGNSMEPKFYDGQRVLVRQQPAVEFGEIGIFIKENERYIKIYRGDHLESANPDYPDVPLEEYSRCIGKVLGILKEEWIVK